MYWDNEDDTTGAWFNEAVSLSNFYHEVAQNPASPDKALFETGAAYLSYIVKDYTKAKKYLQNVQKLNASQDIKGQVTLTQLLVTINERTIIDRTAEAELLPAVKWLQKKRLKKVKE
ncbi:MAG TPA: hypothetical protein VFW07_19065 [Parafilimonas sp.]|nr:hypothetical protein [Parafilimonas sp.]